ncbi:ankyrin repeat protein [Colletotrichum karsti]|uniref:Ankyrin repeat protein n=1 Tax=Colletotrichum karsti TaxID=1095194 RepID=A0A9P6LRA5_9PEZI|nr:ankyrin repeat protein [Colletotrichum karsti]KAF9882257.1 ankyrin repeat protein [Colletotrichum karsti]
MDPSGIIGIIGVVGQIGIASGKLGLNWKEAPDDVKAFMSELRGLSKILFEIQNKLIDNPEFVSAFEGKRSAVIANLATPSSSDDSAVLFTCKEELDGLLQKLESLSQGKLFGWRRMKAAFLNERLQKAVKDSQRRCQSWLTNMIAVDNAALLANTNIEVRSTRKEVRDQRQEEEKKRHLESKKRILDWITPIDFAAQQTDNLDRRQAGTGGWLLDSQEFQAWVENDRQTLFCPGLPGAGKTMLSSIVAEYLQDRFQTDETIGVAYVFCNYRRRDEQTSRNLLASLLKQLYQGLRGGFSDIETVYEGHASGKRPLSTEEIKHHLRSITTRYTKVFLVSDALDECRVEGENRDKFLSSILELRKIANVNCFATSRTNPEIANHFAHDHAIEIRAADDDVRAYLDGHISQLPSSVKKNKELQDDIKAMIVKAVQGMFLLAELQLKSLRGKRSAKAVKECLKKFSGGSDAYHNAYDEAMERIEGQLEDQVTLAKDALSWIICAKRPLTTEELQHALAVEKGSKSLDKDNIPELDDVVSACAGLVTIDEESRIIRLVHYTTQEYFERTAHRWLPDAQRLITFNLNVKDDEGFTPLIYAMAFENYDFVDFLLKFEDVTLNSAILDSSKTSIPGSIRTNSIDVNVQDDTGMTPLSHAVRMYQVKMAELLLASAVEQDQTQMVELLLRTNGIIVDSKNPEGRTSLSVAAGTNSLKILSLLVETGKVNVNSVDNFGWTPLHWAAEAGHEEIVSLLVETGHANPVTFDKNNETPLWTAIDSRRDGVARYLLCKGKVDACLHVRQKRLRRTPLDSAVKWLGLEHEITKLLRERMEVLAQNKAAEAGEGNQKERRETDSKT